MNQSLDAPAWTEEEDPLDTDEWPVKPVRYGARGLGKSADQWPARTESGDLLENAHQLGQDGSSADLPAAGNDSDLDHELLEKIWNRSFESAIKLWEKLEPFLGNYLPEDRNPFWVCAVLVVVLIVAIAGLRVDYKFFHDARKPSNLPIIKSTHVTLPDGRRIAYHEQGVLQGAARHTILIVHGFPSSRLAGIPGIRSSLLAEFGVRLISYDRPGFGESDVHIRRNLRTSAKDMGFLADALGVEDKFWVLGYSTGGVYAWAAMKYIPEKLSGVALFAPAGNLYAPNMTKQVSKEVWAAFTLHQKLLYMFARWVPSLLPSVFKFLLLMKADKLHNNLLVFAGKDLELSQHNSFLEALRKDLEESTRQGRPDAFAHEFMLQVRPWGFHLSDFRIRKKLPPSGLRWLLGGFWNKGEEEWEGFSAPIHIWHGTDDQMVPFAINEFAVQMVPQANLYKLEGEGHYSYFWFCEQCHREIFSTLFKPTDDIKMNTLGHLHRDL